MVGAGRAIGWAGVLAAGLAAALAMGSGCGRSSAGGEDVPTPVYVTLAGHLEDVREYAECREYPRQSTLASA